MASVRRGREVALRQLPICLGVLLLLVPVAAQETQPGLYGQSIAAMLNRRFPLPRVEYLLFDVGAGQPIAMRWRGVERPIPVGSLLKPFVALAYGQLLSRQAYFGAGPNSATASGRGFPVESCHGKGDGCWRAGGHGVLGLEAALGVSCNAYFLHLARELSTARTDAGGTDAGAAAIERVSGAYRLPAPPQSGMVGVRGAQMLIGVTAEWRIPPVGLARAYARLATSSAGEVEGRLLAGMKLAAGPGGTAAKVGSHPGGVLAKTGTAPCVPEIDGRPCVADGDGLAVVLAPAEHPRVLLLVRERSTTGAQAAEVAGKMLSVLEEAHAAAW